MGTYVYGVTQKSKMVAGVGIVHISQYIYKCGWDVDQIPRNRLIVSRIKSGWENKELPQYIVIGEFTEGNEVLERRKENHSVYFDDPYGHGNCVGWLVKKGSRWGITKQHVDMSDWSSRDENGVFVHYNRKLWVSASGELQCEKINVTHEKPQIASILV